jgi:hypothetical protein
MQVRRRRTMRQVHPQRVGEQRRRLPGDDLDLGVTLLAPRSANPGGMNLHSPVGLDGDLDFSRLWHRLVLYLVRGLVVNSGPLNPGIWPNRLDVRQNAPVDGSKSSRMVQKVLKSASMRL